MDATDVTPTKEQLQKMIEGNELLLDFFSSRNFPENVSEQISFLKDNIDFLSKWLEEL